MPDTPGLHNKIPALKIFARGWVAQESVFVTLSTLRFSRGWVRKDGNLVMETRCTAPLNSVGVALSDQHVTPTANSRASSLGLSLPGLGLDHVFEAHAQLVVSLHVSLGGLVGLDRRESGHKRSLPRSSPQMFRSAMNRGQMHTVNQRQPECLCKVYN